MITESRREYNRKWYLANKTIRLEKDRLYRISHKEHYRAYDKARYPKRREADLLRHREKYKLNPGYRKEYNLEYHKKNKDKISEQRKRYRQQHMPEILARNYDYVKRNRDKANTWNATWRKNNRGKVAAAEARRRAAELGARTDPEATEQFFTWVRNQDFVSCTYCGVFIFGKSIEIDHIVPISRGGDHAPDNFCISCRTCNASKSDFLLSEWPKCPEKFRFLQV